MSREDVNMARSSSRTTPWIWPLVLLVPGGMTFIL